MKRVILFIATTGLLSQIGSAPYSLPKPAAVAFAEWMSITYGDHGVRVSCLCPMGVRTGMTQVPDDAPDDLRLAAGVVAAGPSPTGSTTMPRSEARVSLAMSIRSSRVKRYFLA